MARIDEAVLLRCVQVLRRLLVRNKDVGLFCNISGTTLRDVEVFARCLDFLDANRALAPSFVLEIKQATLRSLRPGRERASRRTGPARLPVFDRQRDRPEFRAARTRRPQRAVRQGSGGAAARSVARLRHPSVRSVRHARPVRHRPCRRADRGRARGGRPAGLRRAVRPGLPVLAAAAAAHRYAAAAGRRHCTGTRRHRPRRRRNARKASLRSRGAPPDRTDANAPEPRISPEP